MFYLTFNHKIVDKAEKTFPTHKDLIWIEGEEGFEIGDIYEEGELRKCTPDELNYRQLRALNYPKIRDQLDMIYQDKVNGTNTWEEAIRVVKAKYPKSCTP